LQNAFSGPGEVAFKKLRILLDRVMLRRTKLECADDLGLPPRTVIVRRDYFSPEEKELYLSLFTDAKRQFSTYAEKGTLLNSAYFPTFTGDLAHLKRGRLLEYLLIDHPYEANGMFIFPTY
jgi:SNF2 family DNA or RNA helicase